MPRPVRLHLTGALYYVSCKASEGRALFQEDADFETYLDLLDGYRRQFGFKLFAYALLPERLSLVMELTSGTTISEIMHALNSRYTKHVTKRYGHASHVFHERFRSTLAEKSPSLLPLTLFVHRLPQSLGATADARSYRWSSYAAYRSGAWRREVPGTGGYLTAPDTGAVEVEEVLALLQPGMTYEAMVEAMPRQELDRWQVKLQRAVVGSPAFHQLVEAKMLSRPQPAPAVAPVGPGTAPQPRPGRRFIAPTLALTGSMAIALVSLCATGLSARNLSTLRQTVRAIAQARASITQAVVASAPAVSTAQLASFALSSRLAGSHWDVQVIAMDGAGNKTVQLDELRFSQGKVASTVLSAQGFAESNYSLTLQPDGSLLWETMQTGRSGEVVCWRGEWNGERMRGVMTRQLPGTTATNFTFLGLMKPVQQASRQTMMRET